MKTYSYEELKKMKNGLKPFELLEVLKFDQSLALAVQMLSNEAWDEDLQEYAVALLEEIMKAYPEKWNVSWKFDALLGYAYHITLKYDERYEAYKRAMNKVHPPPPQLLIAMARCCFSPGKPHITEDEGILLVKQAIKDIPYVEGIELLKGLYKSLGNTKEQKYWENVLDSLGENGIHVPMFENILKK